jgi:hypothetical protein
MYRVLHVVGFECKFPVLNALDLAGKSVSIRHDDNIIFSFAEYRANHHQNQGRDCRTPEQDGL